MAGYFLFYIQSFSQSDTKYIGFVIFLFKPINTLEELAFENDDIPVGCFTNYLQKYVKTSTNPYIQKISKTFEAYYDYDKAFERAINGQLVMGESREFAEYNIRTRFTNRYRYFP